jgi:hypothetical protein
MAALNHGEVALAYFSENNDRIDRGGKIVADIFCAAIILMFAIAFFGTLGGLLAFIVVEGALLGVDYVVPHHQDDVSGAVIR